MRRDVAERAGVRHAVVQSVSVAAEQVAESSSRLRKSVSSVLLMEGGLSPSTQCLVPVFEWCL